MKASKGTADAPKPERDPKAAQTTEVPLSIKETGRPEKLAFRQFSGPSDAEAALRVTIAGSAYADVVAHVRESLDLEVCGVLVGGAYQDDTGPFVQVRASIRGTSTARGSTHVTFTQATWNEIHETLERDHPKERIVGWYHSHPGFGVEFSDMDRFIQSNFFGSATQIGLLTDPLSGAVAACCNSAKGFEYVERIWVDGREITCTRPRADTPSDGATSAAGELKEPSSGLDALERRVSQLVGALEELRTSYHRFLLTVLMVVCVGIIAAVGYFIRSQMAMRIEPPRLNSYVPVPVRVGDRTVLLGVAVTEWQVPPELNALLLERDREEHPGAASAAPSGAAPAPQRTSTAGGRAPAPPTSPTPVTPPGAGEPAPASS